MDSIKYKIPLRFVRVDEHSLDFSSVGVAFPMTKDHISNAIAVAGITFPWTIAEFNNVVSLLVAALSALWLLRQLWLSFKKPKP